MSGFNLGDLVEAVKGEELIRGRAGGSGVIGQSGRTVFGLIEDGYTLAVIEKAAPALPTEPGHYLDNEGDMWKLSGGRWRYDGATWRDDEAKRSAPFTRLEPVPVTARRVLERFASFWEFGPPCDIADEINQIGVEFGVTS